MGVEPTVARSARPTANFEDWGDHRNSSTPIPEDTALRSQRQAVESLSPAGRPLRRNGLSWAGKFSLSGRPLRWNGLSQTGKFSLSGRSPRPGG
jgi:hypothetical protein